MKITDLTTLRDAVQNVAAHGIINAMWDLVLQMAESRMMSDIKIRRIEQSIYGTLDSPVLPLPEDVFQYQRLVVYEADREKTLEYHAPTTFERLTGAPGRPEAYTVLDQSLVIYPTPISAHEYALYYIPQVRPLTTENPTNDVLTRAPNVYLYACLAEGFFLVHDGEKGSNFLKLYDDAWRNLQSAEDAAKYPLSTPMQVRLPVTLG